MSVSIPRARALPAGLIAVLALAGPASAFPQPKYPAAAPPASSSPPAAPAAARPAEAKSAEAKPGEAKSGEAKSGAASGSWSVYQVQRGDTLTGVGRRFGESVRTLADLNELEPKTPLKAGSRVKLPPGAADSGKDPYASGPSPFALGESSHAAAEKPKLRRLGQATAEAAPGPAAVTPARDTPTERPPVRRSQARPEVQPAPQAQTKSQAQDEAEPQLQPKPQPQTHLQTQAQAQAQIQAETAPQPAEAEKPAESAQVEAASSDAAVAGKGRFVWPIRGRILTGFGPLAQGQRNDGINIGAERGAEVKAAADGVVVYAGSEVKGYGNTVLIMHPGGWDTVYTHLDKIEVGNRGYAVKQGQVIGTVGSTGDVDQPQLHFETRFSPDAHHKYNPVDPQTVLPQ